MESFQLNSPELVRLEHEKLAKRQIRLRMLRLDQLHPLISGNKWFKLKENIRHAKEQDKRRLLSFGGAYSNHLFALAAAARFCNMKSLGFVRGWHGRDNPSPTLESCRKMGMQIQFLSRQDYARKADPDFLEKLRKTYPDAWIIPEGGNNRAGRSGAKEIATFIPNTAKVIVLPVGTGTTLSGIRSVLPVEQQVLGMAPFMQTEALYVSIADDLDPDKNAALELCNKYHFGGFGKSKPELIRFINDFYQTHGIPLDFIYTGKMMYGLMDQIEKGCFMPGTELLAIHTGGLQGNRSRKDLTF